jgi:hypothetical protein
MTMLRRLLSKIDRGQPFLWREFWLLDWKMRQYIRGNFVAFGFWSGLSANISLMCPLYNTLRYYGIRHLSLKMVDYDGNDLNPLYLHAIYKDLESVDENQD